MNFHGWTRHFDRQGFWAWVDDGCPQPWAFWRFRDEFDGLWLGAIVGLLAVGLILWVAL